MRGRLNMFEERLKELLQIIDYEFYSLNKDNIVLKDLQLPGERQMYDVAGLPCSLLSDDKLRRVECSTEEGKLWGQVRTVELGEDCKEINYFRASTLLDEKEDSYSFEIERSGLLYDMMIGKKDGEEVCHYRMMDIVNGKPFITDVFYAPSKLVISRSAIPHKEQLELVSVENGGRVKLSRNGEVLEEVEIKKNYEELVCGVLSAVNHVVDAGNKSIGEASSDLFSTLVKTYPHYAKLLSFSESSYDADSMDSFFQKHGVFVDDTFIQQYVK